MINQFLSILLALNIVVCPVFCGPSDGCCATLCPVNEADCGQGCDCHGGSLGDGEDPSPVDQGSRDSEHSCQCVCGGAVLKDDVLQALRVELSNSVPIPASLAVAAEVIEPQLFIYRAIVSGDGMNPGRALRCRLMSLLC